MGNMDLQSLVIYIAYICTHDWSGLSTDNDECCSVVNWRVELQTHSQLPKPEVFGHVIASSWAVSNYYIDDWST